MSGAVTATIVAVGVSEATAAAIAAFAVPMLTSAAIGAVGSAIMGGNPLTGALTGAIGGGFGALGGIAGGAMGIGADAGGALFGAAGGALGAGITGGNPLTGALSGGASGLFGQMAQNGDLSSIFGGDSTPSTPGLTPSGENAGQGPTVQAANGLDPSSLNSLAASTPPADNGLSGLSTNPDALNSNSLLSPPNASNSSLFQPASNGTGLNAGQGPTVGNASSLAPAAPTSSWNSISDNPVSNYLFGNGQTSAPSSQTLQQALTKQASSGTAQAFDGGVVQANGTVAYAPAAAAATGAAAKGSNSLTGALGGNSSGGGVLGNLISTAVNNPVQTGLLGLQAYNMSQAPALPTLQQQQAATQGPTFSMNLPQYNATQTRNPIADYYTYGYSPQPTQISTALTAAAPGTQGTGNAPIKLARGGVPRPRLPGAPHLMGAPRHNAGSGAAMLGALSHMRRASGVTSAPIGGALSGGMPTLAHGGMFSQQGQVQMGTGTKGQADKVPAMLSEDEFVMPADVVSSLGDGSSNAGGGVLKQFVANVRAHKGKIGSDGMPPKAKSPEQYLRRA